MRGDLEAVATRSTPRPARWACRSRTSVAAAGARPRRRLSGRTTCVIWRPPTSRRDCLPRSTRQLPRGGRTPRWRDCRPLGWRGRRRRLRDLQRHDSRERAAARARHGAHRVAVHQAADARVQDGQPPVHGDGRADLRRGGFPRSGPVPRVRAIGARRERRAPEPSRSAERDDDRAVHDEVGRREPRSARPGDRAALHQILHGVDARLAPAPRRRRPTGPDARPRAGCSGPGRASRRARSAGRGRRAGPSSGPGAAGCPAPVWPLTNATSVARRVGAVAARERAGFSAGAYVESSSAAAAGSDASVDT